MACSFRDHDFHEQYLQFAPLQYNLQRHDQGVARSIPSLIDRYVGDATKFILEEVTLKKNYILGIPNHFQFIINKYT